MAYILPQFLKHGSLTTIDFEITSQVDELLYGDYEEMSLMLETMFREILQQF